MISWNYITKNEYNNLSDEQRSSDKLFFTKDTQEIYRGSESFSENVVMYTGTKPSNPAVGKLYIDSTTLEGSMWNGLWFTVINPVQETIDPANTTKPVSGKAVSDYFDENKLTLSVSDNGNGDVFFNISKGEYTNTPVAIDSTLTQEGQAADAKATGDAINALSEEIANISSFSAAGAASGQVPVADGNGGWIWGTVSGESLTSAEEVSF